MYFLIILLNILFNSSWGQSALDKMETSDLVVEASGSSSPMDLEDRLAVKRFYIMITDNSEGIYSKIIEGYIKSYINRNKRFEMAGIEISKDSLDIFSDELNKKVLHLDSAIDCDSVLFIRALKSKFNVRLDAAIILTKNAERYADETISIDVSDNNTDFEVKFVQFMNKLTQQLPYIGLITSRYENNVTIDMGSDDGIQQGMQLPIYRIDKIVKHPYLGTIISITRQRIGTIEITNVDHFISFGKVTQESGKFKILKGHKIMKDSLADNATLLLKNAVNAEKIKPQPIDRKTAQEEQSDTGNVKLNLGRASAMFRLMNVGYTVIDSKNNEYSSSAPVSFGFGLDADLWLTKEWFVEGLFMYQLQTFTPSGGTSSSFNSSLSDFHLLGGYKLNVQNMAEIGIKSGFKSVSFFTDAVPAESIHTNKRYRGLYTALFANIPISENFSGGFEGRIMFFNGLTETPSTTGGTYDNSVFGFQLNGSYKLSEYYKIIFGLIYDVYKTSFTGAGTTSLTAVSSSISNKGAFAGVDFDF